MPGLFSFVLVSAPCYRGIHHLSHFSSFSSHDTILFLQNGPQNGSLWKFCAGHAQSTCLFLFFQADMSSLVSLPFHYVSTEVICSYSSFRHVLGFSPWGRSHFSCVEWSLFTTTPGVMQLVTHFSLYVASSYRFTWHWQVYIYTSVWYISLSIQTRWWLMIKNVLMNTKKMSSPVSVASIITGVLLSLVTGYYRDLRIF